MSKGRTAVVLQWAKHRIGVDLVTGRGQITAAIVAAQVVTMRGDRAGAIVDILARNTGIQNRIGDVEG